jgi:hypothetical protein
MQEVDGGARVVGAGPDIGADELAFTTNTTLDCGTASVIYGQESTCMATVSALDPGPLDGTIELVDTSAAGVRTSCELLADGSVQASCVMPYRATGLGREMTLVAHYSGDPTHAGSYAEAEVSLARDPTRTEVSCDPSLLVVGQSTVCAVTVADVVPSLLAPSGQVTFRVEGDATPTAEQCELVEAGPGRATCQATFSTQVAVPAGGGGTQGESVSSGIYGTYIGDSFHLENRSSIAGFKVSLPAAPPLRGPFANRPDTALKHGPPRRTRRRWRRSLRVPPRSEPVSSLSLPL